MSKNNQDAIFAPASPKQEMMFKAFLESQITVIGGAAGCVSAETEFLTDEGWVRFDKYTEDMNVAVYNPETDKLKYTKEVEYVKLPCTHLTKMQGKGLEMVLSDEHKVLYWNDKLPNHRTLPFSEVKNRHEKSKTKGWTGRIKTTFNVENQEGLDLTEGELRLQVAVMADGKIVLGGKNNYTQMRFSKERKYKRLLELCRKFNLPYKDNGSKENTKYSNNTEYEVIVWPQWNNKRYDKYFWKSSQEQLDIIADEVGHWDGSIINEGKTVRYFSKYKEDCDFIQYVFASQSMNTSVVEDNREGKISYTTNGQVYGKGFRSFANKDGKCPLETVETSDGYKYCFTTETGFFIARCNNKIFLTGNSGKSYLLQLMPLCLVDDPKTKCIMFRRTTPQITGQGGIWDTAKGIFNELPIKQRPKIREIKLEAIFPNGASVKYQHMERVADKLNIQGLTCSPSL